MASIDIVLSPDLPLACAELAGKVKWEEGLVELIMRLMSQVERS